MSREALEFLNRSDSDDRLGFLQGESPRSPSASPRSSSPTIDEKFRGAMNFLDHDEPDVRSPAHPGNYFHEHFINGEIVPEDPLHPDHPDHKAYLPRVQQRIDEYRALYAPARAEALSAQASRAEASPGRRESSGPIDRDARKALRFLHDDDRSDRLDLGDSSRSKSPSVSPERDSKPTIDQEFERSMDWLSRSSSDGGKSKKSKSKKRKPMYKKSLKKKRQTRR